MTRGKYRVRKGPHEAIVTMPDHLAKRFKGAVRVGDADAAPVTHISVNSWRVPAWWRRALAYLRAVWSKFAHGPTPKPAAAARLEACRSCEHRQVVEGKGEFCGRCGCGTRRSAELTIKVTMPAATCPIGKWPA